MGYVLSRSFQGSPGISRGFLFFAPFTCLSTFLRSIKAPPAPAHCYLMLRVRWRPLLSRSSGRAILDRDGSSMMHVKFGLRSMPLPAGRLSMPARMLRVLRQLLLPTSVKQPFYGIALRENPSPLRLFGRIVERPNVLKPWRLRGLVLW